MFCKSVLTVRVFLAIFFSHFCLMPNLVKCTFSHRCWHLFRYAQFTLHDSLACTNSSNGPFHLHLGLHGHRISNASTFFLAAWSGKTSFGSTSWSHAGHFLKINNMAQYFSGKGKPCNIVLVFSSTIRKYPAFQFRVYDLALF